MSASNKEQLMHPAITGSITVVQELEDKLRISDEPTQYLPILELGAAASGRRNRFRNNG